MAIYQKKPAYTFEGPPNRTFKENFAFNGKPIDATRVYVNYPIGAFSYNLFSALPSTTIRDVSWAPNGRVVAFACSGVTSPTTNPTIAPYYFDGVSFTKLLIPYGIMRLGGDAYAVEWSPDGKYLAIGSDGPYKVDLYEFYSVDILGGYSMGPIEDIPLPATFASDSVCTGLSWSPDGTYLAASFSKEPFNYIYQLSVAADGTTSLTPYSSLDKNYSISSTDCAWSPNGRYLAVGYTRPPYLGIYEFDGKSFNKLPGSTAIPQSSVNSVSWSPDGKAVAASHGSYPAISAFSFKNNALERLSILPERTSPDSSYRVTWSSDGRYLGATFNSTPKFGVYKFDGAKLDRIVYSYSLGPNTTTSYAMAWGPDGENLIIGSARSKSSPGVSTTSTILELDKPKNKPS